MQAAVPNPTAPPSSQPHPIVPSMDVPKHSVMDQPAPEPPVSDAASVHSMPAVRITEPATPVDQARSPVSNEFSSLSGRAPPASPVTPTSRSNTAQEDSTSLTQQQRRARHRSAIEPRSSNRLSGFFNNLIHRREPHNASSREPIIQENAPQQEQPTTTSEAASRASSPLPTRPVTPPPPPLPPPTLQELGLSLSAMTTELAPSHFSTPPFSGAFLAPHYLLLCHAQGLDVLPLTSPPAAQPYALVRRVSFKSVVVMEHRGVLVAIAGRRDGVRVYALEEVKKAIEWRIEVELKRERDRTRRENTRKPTLRPLDILESRESAEKTRKASLSTPPPGDSDRIRANILRKSSLNALPLPTSPPPVPLVPRSATPRTPRKRSINPSVQIPSNPPGPSGHPPPYVGPSETSVPSLQSRPSFVSLRPRTGSVSNVLAGAPSHRAVDPSRAEGDDSKADWAESSDEEAIDVVAAGSSGSHLDERTSATLSPNLAVTSPQLSPILPTLPLPPISRTITTATAVLRRNRPSNLDLTLARTQTIPPSEPSPAPTLITLRQALTQTPPALDGNEVANPDTPFFEGDDDEEEIEGHISLAQALLESRIPDLPPIGTRRAQEPIIITPSNSLTSRPASEEPSIPSISEEPASIGRNTSNTESRRRRRWSIMISSPSSEASHADNTPSNTVPSTAPATRLTNRFTRSHSFRSNISQATTMRSASAMEPVAPASAAAGAAPARSSVPDLTATRAVTPTSSRASRFIPRIISNALHRRKSSERLPVTPISPIDANEGNRWTPHQSPPPKLEYVKLPGTKGALLVKAVETAKKSFLAILCGDNGEKVELFAGTYRTALGLSRTFILPDSPRSLELQLQGDDLVEVFLVFAQNVFGLEPATVRVREVRIGRAERRAARRRARENRPGEQSTNEADQLEEETNVSVSIGVSVPSTVPAVTGSDAPTRSGSPTLVANEHPSVPGERTQTPEPTNTTSNTQSEDLLLLATAQMGPYTTFQQLQFAPNFPLASIADEYIIPPTYPSFLEYKAEHEPNNDGSASKTADLAQTQFSPPGLPVPTPTTPPKWYYRDPKNVVHGPWKSSLMQAWYKDGLLPPDLPVRREEDTDYMLLKDLRLQSVDPTQPFRVVAPLVDAQQTEPSKLNERLTSTQEMQLLSPISLLEQPRHFGPPALFFSSRGGHSTSIVDVRGRSVLKGKFLWSNDDADSAKVSSTGKLGDVKRLEAFDVKKGAVLVAMRQGGLEVVDLGDALLNPADQSRTVLPNYNPPLSNINRRAPFIWKIGSPLTTPTTSQGAGLDSKTTGSYGLSMGKKVSLISTKNSNSKTDSFSPDFDVDPQDEVLFLGRKEDEVYLCERNAVSFRILRLSPTSHDTV